MRYQSKDRARLMRKWGPVRFAWRLKWHYCWACGSMADPCVDEIVRGAHRELGVQHPQAWFRACWTCNASSGQLNDATLWPLERKLALKWINDREQFDLALMNTLRGRAPGAITFSEVIPFICRHLDGNLF